MKRNEFFKALAVLPIALVSHEERPKHKFRTGDIAYVTVNNGKPEFVPIHSAVEEDERAKGL